MKRILLSLAHMSGKEEEFIREAFDSNWVVLDWKESRA